MQVGGQVSENEVRAFVSSCIPELQYHPSFVSALTEHLLLPFRNAKTEAYQRFRGQSTQVCIYSLHVERLPFGSCSDTYCTEHGPCLGGVSFEILFNATVVAFLRHHNLHVYVHRCAPPALSRSSQPSAGEVHERAEAFETLFTRKHSVFQLYCRGVSAFGQALRNRTVLDDDSTPAGGTAENKPSNEGRRTCVELKAEEAERRAESYLLRTAGADLADMITSRECSKLVRISQTVWGGGEGPSAQKLAQRVILCMSYFMAVGASVLQ